MRWPRERASQTGCWSSTTDWLQLGRFCRPVCTKPTPPDPCRPLSARCGTPLPWEILAQGLPSELAKVVLALHGNRRPLFLLSPSHLRVRHAFQSEALPASPTDLPNFPHRHFAQNTSYTSGPISASASQRTQTNAVHNTE